MALGIELFWWEKKKHGLLFPIMTVQFVAQIVLHDVGVVKSDSKNSGDRNREIFLLPGSNLCLKHSIQS
jgi:hypothetical protein